MKQEFTPGPWRIYSDEESRECPSTTHVQADDDEPNGCMSVAMCVGDQHYQNARLIAAAPDLLEELQGMADLFDAWGGFRPYTPQEVGARLIAVRAAIAKAIGRTS